jgi:hypothetical protein
MEKYMRIKSAFYFLFLILGSNLAMAYDPYCHSICHYECTGFYDEEGITPKIDPAPIKLCVDSCMDKKCPND